MPQTAEWVLTSSYPTQRSVTTLWTHLPGCYALQCGELQEGELYNVRGE